MALLYISSLVPEKKEYWNPAFARSAQNVVYGIAKELPAYDKVELVSCPAIPSYPKGPLWVSAKDEVLDDGQILHIWPILNILIVKIIFWGFYSLYYIPKWARTHKGESKRVLCFNTYTPPVAWLYKACKWANAKLHIIIMDLGVPPKHQKISRLRMWGFESSEKSAHKYIPNLDGRIIINEKIIDVYAPGKDYILIDGGINNEVIKRLFPLKISENKTITCVLAGLLWAQNGTKLVMQTLRKYPKLDVKVIFAGNGIDVPQLEEMAKSDSRIQYVSRLTMDELFKYYEQADVLLNLRIEEEVDMHFPSKLLECLTMGKLVISTPVAHADRDYGQYMEVLHNITPDGFATKLQEIYDRPKQELLEKGMKAREFMLQNRTWKIRTKEFMEYVNSK
ncbi:MAG: glycosyltransferase [Paludibacteraceae bacterium]